MDSSVTAVRQAKRVYEQEVEDIRWTTGLGPDQRRILTARAYARFLDVQDAFFERVVTTLEARQAAVIAASAPVVSHDVVFAVGGRILESKAVGDGKEWPVLIVEVGTSKNGVTYTAPVLREATPLYEGAASFLDHDNGNEDRWASRSVKDKLGRVTGAHFGARVIGGKLVEGVYGRLRVVNPMWREMIAESLAAGDGDFVGLSHNILASFSQRQGSNQKEVTKITRVISVDLVDAPSAGGRVLSA